MEGHKHQGKAPAHGFKVGIATAAVAELYERLLREPLENLDVDAAAAAWPGWEETEAEIRRLCPLADVARIALQEAGAKWPGRSQLRAHLERVREAWPGLRGRLKEQLLPADELRRRLQEVGAPSQPEEIGISRERLAASFRPACYLRRRYTALDLALRIGVLG
jgi:glycerol-1-phosphate dehydrogenase [NAD(P)+]